MNWRPSTDLRPRNFTCGYCGTLVGSRVGATTEANNTFLIYSCPHCSRPTFFEAERQFPGPAYGAEVRHLPEDVGRLFREIRDGMAAGVHTAVVLACRKLLMHVAVANGAPPNLSFMEYVQSLSDKGFVPPNGKQWVDHIRRKGNEANHEIRLMDREEAARLVTFAQMLLRFVYEFPNEVPPA